MSKKQIECDPLLVIAFRDTITSVRTLNGFYCFNLPIPSKSNEFEQRAGGGFHAQLPKLYDTRKCNSQQRFDRISQLSDADLYNWHSAVHLMGSPLLLLLRPLPAVLKGAPMVLKTRPER